MTIRPSAIASYALILAVTCALFISGATLNYLGLNYSTDVLGGGLKLHPYTFLTVIAVIATISGRNRLQHALRNLQFRIGIIGALASVAIILVKMASGDGQSLGFAIDTLVAAFLFAAVSPVLTRDIKKSLTCIALCFVFVECLLAIAEAITRANLIPVDVWYGAYFRATALQGHPLNNALILVTVSTSLQAVVNRRMSLLIFFLTAIALTAFGGRGGLAVYLIVNAVTVGLYGMRSSRRALIVLTAYTLGTGVLWFILTSGVFGDRISEVGAYDNSSEARVQAFQIVRQLNPTQVLFGNGSIEVAKILEQANIGVIENFIVGYVLNFGIILTAIIFYLAYRICKSLLLTAGPLDKKRLLTIIFVFVCTSLTNNSLLTKTPALYLLFVGLWFASARGPSMYKPTKVGA